MSALSDFAICKSTLEGARVSTHCMYPSFEPVHVFIVGFGDGFRVHDAAGAFVNAWKHGKNEDLITKALRQEASRYQLQLKDNVLSISIENEDWLASAILSVANASANAAISIAHKYHLQIETDLLDQIQYALASKYGSDNLKKDFEVRGKSGGKRKFDLALVGAGDKEILINGVSPYPNSVSSRYVTFADVEGETMRKFAVFNQPLATADTALLQQVAKILPLRSLELGADRAMQLA